jgi:predicted site-specific integrase-resolvase
VDKLLSTSELAEYLGFSARTIEGWRRSGYGPDFKIISGRAKYTPEDVQRWLDEKSAPAEPKRGE